MNFKKNRKKILSSAVSFVIIITTLLSPGLVFADETATEEPDGTEAVVVGQSDLTATPTATLTPTTEITEEVTEADSETTEEATEEATEIPGDVSAGASSDVTEEATEETEEPTPTETQTPTPTLTPTPEIISAQDVDVPVLTSPVGSTYDRTPTFKWNQVADAYKYTLIVFKISSSGDIKQYEKELKDSKYCDDDDSTCSVTPSTSLSIGDYKWKMRVYYANGIWGEYTGYSEFAVTNTDTEIIAPDGLVYTSSPTFEWKSVVDATQYRIIIYDSDGDEVIDQIYTDSDYSCSDGVCSMTFPNAFETGSYKWRIKAYYNGKWKDWTSKESFTIGTDGIDETFDSYNSDWVKVGGASWVLSGGLLYTSGTSGYMSSVRYAYKYEDFEVSASVMRESGSVDGQYPASYIGVRMGKSKTSDKRLWYSGYIFGYTNAGTYSIWRMSSSGTPKVVQPWTETTAINQGGWNTLTVSAEGSTLAFSINGTGLKSFTDSNFSSGYVGFEMYKPSSASSPFYIDSVTLTQTEVSGTSFGGVSAQQATYNAEALADADDSSVVAYDATADSGDEDDEEDGTDGEESEDEGTVTSQAIDTPTLISPDDDAYLYTTNKPTYEWSAVDGATKYAVFLAKVNEGGVDKVYEKTYSSEDICDSSTCTVTPDSTLSQNDYRWRVKAYDGSDWSEYSGYYYFTIDKPVPTAEDPDGTIYENTPEFSWTEIEGADRYNVFVYDEDGDKVMNEYVYTTDITCSDSLCSYTPDYGGEVNEFEEGDYRWRVRAHGEAEDKWYASSGYQSFTVGTYIDSDFEENNDGWSRLWGAKWYRSSAGYMYTDGKSGKWTSLKYDYSYDNFEFETSVYRDGGDSHASYPATFLCARMKKSKTSSYMWYTGYIFGYSNAGNYSVWRMDSGGKIVTIQDWEHTSAITPFGWNDLRVVAYEDEFEFYINGTLVASFEDDTYSRGYIGYEMYSPGKTNDRLWIDYAYLSSLDVSPFSALSATSEDEGTGVVSAESELLGAASVEITADSTGDSAEESDTDESSEDSSDEETTVESTSEETTAEEESVDDDQEAIGEVLIESEFDEDIEGWDSLWGGKWYRSTAGYLYTDGESGKWTNIKNDSSYDNFDMTAQVYREADENDTAYPGTFLCVRMQNSRTSSNMWYTGYIFGYSNAGNYSIWRMDSGGNIVTIQPWTNSSSIQSNVWNEMRVVADYDMFEFYINDDLVYTFSDDTYSSGYVGFEMYDTDNRLWIDSISLTSID